MPEIHYSDEHVTLYHGDCLDVLRELPDASVDAVVTDPPYGLEFMGKGWDAPWEQADVNADAGFHGGGISATKNLPSFTGTTNPKCLVCKGTRRGRRDGTAKVAVCLCENGGVFPNTRAVEMRAFQEWCGLWAAECLRVLKPGGHMLAFGGSRTWHRLAAAVEDAGFEVRDSIAWLYGSGFPKSLDVSKAIDKAAGAERPVLDTIPDRWAGKGSVLQRSLQAEAESVNITAPATPDAERWQGWGTALKPAFEPVVVARKPIVGTVAANVLAHGTGALNIDATRTPAGQDYRDKCASVVGLGSNQNGDAYGEWSGVREDSASPAGRWPTNVVLDESQAAELDEQSGYSRDGVAVNRHRGETRPQTVAGAPSRVLHQDQGYGGGGGASRFFPTFRYEAKAPTAERPRAGETAHPTVKPLDLMRWLVRLVTPPGGTVLEPFAGSGTTAEACVIEGFHCIAIEREADYLPLITQRLTKPIALALDF